MAKVEPHPEAFSNLGPRRPRKHGEGHLAWIRTLPSVISGRTGCEACHIRYGSLAYGKRDCGIGEKPDDAWTVPLTPAEHRRQHSMGEQQFWGKVGIDPLRAAAALFVASGDEVAATSILQWARMTAKPGKGRP